MLDYLARRVGSAERDALEAHVDTCSACRQLLGELARSTLLDELVAPDPAHEPTQLGRYRIESRLGGGGMGTVYAAHDPQLDRRVAVKLVHPELAARGGIERLLREGRSLARLAHPNVVGVHDAGVDEGRVYVAMELVAGQTLAAWLADTPRGWREIVDKFVDAGRGLAAAHRAGIVHRDVKPENILLDGDGRAKVADFGLAGQPTPASEIDLPPLDAASRLTHPGVVMGTPLYMSPEQRRGDDVGPTTDQYALCAACWHALSGLRVPRWLRRALARGLAAAASDRHPSMDALVVAIDPARHARRRRIAVAAGVLAVAAGTVTVLALRPNERAQDPALAACATATAANAMLWGPAERHAVQRAMLATGVPVRRTDLDAGRGRDRDRPRRARHGGRPAVPDHAAHRGDSRRVSGRARMPRGSP